MTVKNTVVFLLLLTVITISFWFANTNVNYPAPNETFTTITGKKINLHSLQGKPVLVTFWATDCANCVKEIPDFVELYQHYQEKGLEIIAVTMYYDPPNHVVAMTAAKQIPYPVALDLKNQHARAFGHVELTPSTFLISPAGNIVMKTTGLLDIHDIKQRLDNFFKG